MRDDQGRTVCLSHHQSWLKLGGPDAMQAEREKCIVLCFNCHWMASTGNVMQERINPDSLPVMKQGDNPQAYHKRNHLVNKRKKQDYVDAKKIEIGGCAECQMKVVSRGSDWTPADSGWPHVFQFAHRSELDKDMSISRIVDSKRTFDNDKGRLDREIARCRLLCMCCGQVETDERATEPGPSEEGN